MQAEASSTVFLPVLLEKHLGIPGDIVFSLVQGRNLDMDHADPIIEVLTEIARLNHFPQILMGGDDQPDVDPDRALAA